VLDLGTPRYFDYKTDSSSIGVGILSWLFRESRVHMDATQSQRVVIVLACVLLRLLSRDWGNSVSPNK